RYAQDGRTKGVTLAARFEINDAQAAIKSAAAGDGVTIALSYMVDEELKAGRLVPVLAEFWPDPAPVNLVYPAGRAPPAKLRAFVDFAAPEFKVRLASVVGAP
ncbi:MAG: LysR family transcriptional regulator, partial [Pseudogulbenkiania sp.]|nr:LysR family transcriptional regulator [Pseudogulbenkiania sp.]